MPNHYDSQRFGSIKGTGEFPAVEIMRESNEGALKLLMASYYRKERSHVKKIKGFLGAHWGQWSVCRKFLEKERKYESFHEIVGYLEENPRDCRGALELSRGSIMELVTSSFQSFLWNEALKEILRRHLRERRLYRVKYAAGYLPFHRKKKPTGILEGSTTSNWKRRWSCLTQGIEDSRLSSTGSCWRGRV